MHAKGKLLIAVIVFVVGGSMTLSFLSKPDGDRAATFAVAQGESTALVVKRLKSEGVIRSELLFKRALAKSGLETKLQPGVYDLRGVKTFEDIIVRLADGGVSEEEFVLLVKEGATLGEIREELARVGYTGGNLFEVTGVPAVDARTFSSDKAPWARDYSDVYTFLADKPTYVSLEGFLFPDTYRIFKDATPDEIVQKMLDHFDHKLTTEMRAKIRASGHSIFDVVTMASIIEREVHQESERPKIADLFWRRLEAGMPLQADSTVNYVTGKGMAAVTIEDTQNVSLYNTYKHRGLPLGPISNPGLSALNAAISPQPNDAWYFLTDAEGNVHYARTFDEHVNNKQKYLR